MQLAAIPAGGRAGASTSQRLAGVPAPRTRRHAIRCSKSLSAGRASRARPPFRSVRAAGRQNITRLWWLDTRPMALDYPNLTPLPPWTKPFASSRIAAITSFVPCPKAYEGGTWDIAKTSRRCRAWCPLSPALPHSGKSCPLVHPSHSPSRPRAPPSGSISVRSC